MSVPAARSWHGVAVRGECCACGCQKRSGRHEPQLDLSALGRQEEWEDSPSAAGMALVALLGARLAEVATTTAGVRRDPGTRRQEMRGRASLRWVFKLSQIRMIGACNCWCAADSRAA